MYVPYVLLFFILSKLNSFKISLVVLSCVIFSWVSGSVTMAALLYLCIYMCVYLYT